MRTLILAACAGFALSAHAYQDQRCAADCRASGSGWQFCQQRCEFNPAAGAPQVGQTDRACVQRCQSQGYAYQLCNVRCGQ